MLDGFDATEHPYGVLPGGPMEAASPPAKARTPDLITAMIGGAGPRGERRGCAEDRRMLLSRLRCWFGGYRQSGMISLTEAYRDCRCQETGTITSPHNKKPVYCLQPTLQAPDSNQANARHIMKPATTVCCHVISSYTRRFPQCCMTLDHRDGRQHNTAAHFLLAVAQEVRETDLKMEDIDKLSRKVPCSVRWLQQHTEAQRTGSGQSRRYHGHL